MPMSQRRLPDEVDAKRCSTFIRDEFVQGNKASLADWGHGVKVCPLTRKDSVLALQLKLAAMLIVSTRRGEAKSDESVGSCLALRLQDLFTNETNSYINSWK